MVGSECGSVEVGGVCAGWVCERGRWLGGDCSAWFVVPFVSGVLACWGLASSSGCWSLCGSCGGEGGNGWLRWVQLSLVGKLSCSHRCLLGEGCLELVFSSVSF